MQIQVQQIIDGKILLQSKLISVLKDRFQVFLNLMLLDPLFAWAPNHEAMNDVLTRLFPNFHF